MKNMFLYVLTDEGGEVLVAWVAHMERKAGRLLDFVRNYRLRVSQPQFSQPNTEVCGA